MKKLVALLLAGVMVFSLAACGSSSDDETNTTSGAAEAETNETVTYGEVVSTVEWVNDGETSITDASFDEYFDGTAAEGVAALMNAGLVSVNGIAVPATEEDTEDYQVNMVSSLYKTDSGWGYNVHKTTSADNLSFDDARTGFYDTITQVRGHVTTLGLDADGKCVSIDCESYEVMRLAYFEDHGGTVDKIDRGDFELETNRVRYDANNITGISSSNFDSEISMGDIVIYWYESDGWHMIQATPVEGTLAKNDDGQFVINGTDTRTESNVSRYNLINSSRPTQFYDTYVRLELTDIEVITWCTPTGHPIGFTYGDNSKTALSTAIENAEALIAETVVSVDGSDVPSDQLWATQDAVDEFTAAIDEAKSVLNDNSSSAIELDTAVYTLGVAWGESGDNPSGFVGSQGNGTQE